MSDRYPGAGGYPDEDPPPWPEGPGSSVFDRPSRPRPPAPRPPAPRPYVPPPDPSTYPTEQWPGPLYPDQGGYAPPDHGGHPPPDHGGYAPPDRGGYPPPAPPGGGRPPGDRGGARRRADRPGPSPGGRRADEPARSGGSGLPFGLGLLVGLVGLGCFLAGLVVLPWFVVRDDVLGDQEVRLEDIRSSFAVAETDPDDLLPDQGTDPPPDPGAEPDATTLPGGIPTPGELGEAAEDQVQDAAATAAASALDEGKARYLELYTDTLWMVVAGAAVLAVVFSTVLSPRSFALSLLLGFRRISGAVTVLGAAAHGAALWVVFSGDGAPTPAWGVWLGVGGLAGVLLACIIGPKG